LNALDDFGEFIDYFISGKAEMYYIAYASDTLDGVDIYQATLTSSDNYKNDEVSKLLDESAETVDPAKRLKLLQDVAVVADEDVPVVPLSTRDNLWLMNKDYDIAQDMPSSFLSVYFSKAQLK
jgi:ABC-type transport system substrate-binding protein